MGISSNSTPALPPQLLPSTLTNHSGNSVCQQQAIMMADAARTHRPVAYKLRNSDTPHEEPRETFKLVWRRSARLCAQPVSVACVEANGTGTFICVVMNIACCTKHCVHCRINATLQCNLSVPDAQFRHLMQVAANF
jgi:hypothetical protein